MSVVNARTFDFAETDGKHLREAALESPREARVPFHAVDQEYAVALPRIARSYDFDAGICPAERDHIEGAHYRAFHRMFVDPVVREDARLPFGRARAVASHGREHKWLATARFQEIDHCAENNRY